jgi:thiamine biosynthesis lipoprotein
MVVPGRSDSTGWRIGVEDPSDGGRLLAVVPLFSGAVATSGTRARGQHIVDPRTGVPASQLHSVTVVGPSLLWADVYATAAMVKGTDAAGWLEGVSGYDGLLAGPAGVRATSGLVGTVQRAHQMFTGDMSG